MEWADLCDDVIYMILGWRFAPIIQASWKMYRIRMSINRYKMLRHIRPFRDWNPTLREFLRRSRLLTT